MQSSLHDIVVKIQFQFPIIIILGAAEGPGGPLEEQHRTEEEEEGEEEVAHGQKEKLNFAIQRMEERGHQEKVNCVNPQETSGAKPSWLKPVLLLFQYD